MKAGLPVRPSVQVAIRWDGPSAADTLAEVLAVLLLVGAVLYNLIGQSPFNHGGGTYGADVSPVNRWIWLALFGLALPILWLRLAEAVALLKASWLIGLLYVWFGSTTLWALDPAASSRRFLLIVVALIVMAAIAVGISSGRTMLHAIAWCCSAILLIDLGSWVVVPGLAMTDAGLAGIHVHKNGAGAIGLYALLACTTYAFAVRGWGARAAWLAAAAASGLLLAMARSATSSLIALGAILLLPAIVLLLRRPGVVVGAVLGWLAVTFGSALLLYGIWTAVEQQDLLAPFADVTFTQRTDVWSYVAGEIAKHPIGGVGFASFWDIDPVLQPSLRSGLWFASGTEFTNESHNGYLDLFVTTGAIGLAGALLVLLRAIGLAARAAFRAASADRRGAMGVPEAVFHMAWLLCFAVHNTMESSYFIANVAYAPLFLLSALWLERVNLQERRADAGVRR